MASSKVTLRTAFNDRFTMGEVVVTQEGTEFPSKAKADEAIEVARRSGVTLYVVEDVPAATDDKKTGSGS